MRKNKTKVERLTKDRGANVIIKKIRKRQGRRERNDKDEARGYDSKWQQKRKIMERKKVLRSKKERKDNDLIWKKRKR